MPINNGRGYSASTPDKELGFRKIVSQQLAIVDLIYKKPYGPRIPYIYIDTHAGPGHNSEVNCMGSPAVFLELAKPFPFPFSAYFIEKNWENYKELENVVSKTQIRENGEFRIFHDSYENALPKLLENVPKNSFGLVYLDPNSFPDFELLSTLFAEFSLKRVDLLVHLSATALKRCASCSAMDYKSLMDYIGTIDKKEWFVRDVLGDPHQMTFLFGTNMLGYKENAHWRIWNIKSPKGIEVLTFLTHPRKQYDRIAPQLYGGRVWW